MWRGTGGQSVVSLPAACISEDNCRCGVHFWTLPVERKLCELFLAGLLKVESSRKYFGNFRGRV